MPSFGANIRAWTAVNDSTVTVVNTMIPLAPNRSQTAVIADASGMIERTAVRVRTGTINTGKPVETT